MALSKEKEKELAETILGAFRASKEDRFRQYKEVVWDKCYKNYRGKIEKPIPRKSNLFIPVTNQTIETIVTRELGAIFSGDALFKFEARKQSEVNDAEAMSKFANFDINRVPHKYRKMADFLRTMHIYGTAIFKVGWDLEFFEDDKGFLKFTRDQFGFDVISPRNFFIDPVAKRIDEAKWIITRSLVDSVEFKKMVDRLEFISLKKDDIKKLETPMRASIISDDIQQMDIKESVRLEKDRKFIEILEYWNIREDRFSVLAAGNKIIKDGNNPFDHKRFPFLAGVDIPDPEHFWGIGTCEVISDLQSELNSLRNARMDKVNFLMNPMYKVKMTALLNRKELISRQGGIVRVQDQNDITELNLGQMKTADFSESQEIKTDIQTASSINDFSLGQTGTGGFNETATGISIIDANAASRIIGKVEYLEEEVLIPFGFLWLEIQKQFMDDKQIFFLTGEEVVINKQMTLRDFDLKVVASKNMVNKQVRMNQLVQLGQIMLNNPFIDQSEFLRELLNAFGLNSNKLISNNATLAALSNRFAPVNGSAQGTQQPDPNAFIQSGQAQSPEPQGRNFITGTPV